MFQLFIEKLLGHAARAGDLIPDADLRLVIPANGACSARRLGSHNVRELPPSPGTLPTPTVGATTPSTTIAASPGHASH